MLSNILKYKDLFLLLVGRTLKIRYKRSVLGFFWSLLNPLFLIVVYAIFLKILKFYQPGNPLFLPMLVSGIFVWQFLAMSLGDSLHTIIGNSNLVAKTSFPRIILPMSMVTANLVNFLLSLGILAVYAMALGILPSRLWLLPVVLGAHFALCLGLSLIVSALNVFFRDTEHLLAVVLLAWFFLTPIIYPFSQIPLEYQRLAFLNPMTGIVTAYRSIFLSTDIMAPRLAALSLCMSLAICAVGVAFFQRVERRFVEAL